MRYSRARLAALGYELPSEVVASTELEGRLAPVYRRLGLEPGQLEQLTGIRERRWWPPGFRLSEGAARAGAKALSRAGVDPREVGLLVYAGVCREGFEPATACAAAEALGIGGSAAVYDLSNACLGVLNGMVEAANRIELGQTRAALVLTCESARDINEATLARMLEEGGIQGFKDSLATLTGGSGAAAALLTDGSFGGGSRLLGGVHHAAPEHHRLCRWGLEGTGGSLLREAMRTDAAAVLQHGVALGLRSWEAFLRELSWSAREVDKTICHQVGAAHQREILAAFGVPREKDFTTFETLGNMGTASLPLTAAVAAERGFLRAGDRVAFLGIGSGLNTLLLGLSW